MPGDPPTISPPPHHGLTLAPESEAEYLRTIAQLLRDARLNTQYPSARALIDHLSCLSPDLHEGLADPIEVDRRSGLPSFRCWMRAWTDRSLAAASSSDLPDTGRSEGAYATLGARRRYYQKLLAVDLHDRDTISVELRRSDPETRRAWFRVIFDKLELDGSVSRYEVYLNQGDELFRRPLLELDDDAIRPTEAFRSVILIFSGTDAEFGFQTLAKLPHIEVESVSRARVGPIFAPSRLERVAPQIRDLPWRDDQIIATFSLDRAARDLARDCDNDPLTAWYVSEMSEAARAGYLQARDSWNYRVFRDRKFVASAEMVAPLRTMCKTAGTRNVIRRFRKPSS